MKYGSVCSGIEAASVAWESLGWKPSFFSEIKKFPRAVLQHHYPTVPLHGDFTTIGEKDYGAIELLVGGTPCQSFSVAGLRAGMDDERGNLALEYLKLAQRKRPEWLVWENVPGVLSSNAGRDFGSFLGAMVELGYGFAYRILDAQHFGIPQRRRRVFVVGYFGNWRPAAAVLFERDCLRRSTAQIKKSKQNTAGTITSGTGRRRGAGQDPGGLVVSMFRKRGLSDYTEDTLASTIRARDRKEASDLICVNAVQDPCISINCAHPVGRNRGGENVIVFEKRVRRLTPTECERLQGFPDDFTKIPWRKKPAELCPDGPRYEALGNSMPVPAMRWIGERIVRVNEILRETTA